MLPFVEASKTSKSPLLQGNGCFLGHVGTLDDKTSGTPQAQQIHKTVVVIHMFGQGVFACLIFNDRQSDGFVGAQADGCGGYRLEDGVVDLVYQCAVNGRGGSFQLEFRFVLAQSKGSGGRVQRLGRLASTRGGGLSIRSLLRISSNRAAWPGMSSASRIK